jgi:hypothetical protein
MLYRLLIIVLLVLAKMPVDAATLKGVILANELSDSPSENVAVDAISGTNLTVSDLSGKFTLEFPQRRIGDTVRILSRRRVTLLSTMSKSRPCFLQMPTLRH